jgi:hypothetical protein
MPIKSEEAFRFLNVRPVQRIEPEQEHRLFARYEGASLLPAGFSPPAAAPGGRPAKAAAAAAVAPEASRSAAIEQARRRLVVADDADGPALAKLAAAVGRASEAKTVASARDRIKEDLGSDPAAFLVGAEESRLYDAAWERLYAQVLAPDADPHGREAVIATIRHFHFLKRLADEPADAVPMRREEIGRVTPVFPKSLTPPPQRRLKDQDGTQAEAVQRVLAQVHGQMLGLNAAIADLRKGEQMHRTETRRTQVSLPEAIRRAAEAAETMQAPPATDARTAGVKSSIAQPAATAPGPATAPEAPLPSQSQSFDIAPPSSWVFGEFGRTNLAESTLSLLSDRAADFDQPQAQDVILALEKQKYELVSGYVDSLAPKQLALAKSSSMFTDLLESVPVPWPDPVRWPEITAVETTPAARGVQPLGIGDLFVVRQELDKYDTGDVAHIENILRTEIHSRTHVRSRETEEILITESERTEESEQDLTTGQRYEMQVEAQKAIEKKMSLEAGVTASGSYGTTSFSAHADFALSNATSESNKTASKFAKEVIEKSASRIMTRTKEIRNTRTLERVEEKNEHGFNNEKGSGHVIGIYRYVDKYYKVKLINYGCRLMFQFIIPEPAAFYLYLEASRPPKGLSITRPDPPRVSGRALMPADLFDWNYEWFVGAYGLEGVEPHPPGEKRVSAGFADAVTDVHNICYAKISEKLVVPGGYQCELVFGRATVGGYGKSFFTEVGVAGQGWGWMTPTGVEGILPIAVQGYLGSFTVHVIAVCKLTDAARRLWQQKTYDAIMQGYERRLAEYNEQLSMSQIQGGVSIQGRNPELNRKIERDELKKGALRLLTDDFAETGVGGGAWRLNEEFDATADNGEYGYPEFNAAEAMTEGRIIQFFEQAFEWQNMTYRFYPYIWGRKANWPESFPRTDTDPQFTDFLRAGAVRVVVPVAPDYDAAVLHYLATNEIWNGGAPPVLDDPLYISIVDELKADAGGDIDAGLAVCSATSGYPCLADEWELKLPTTLVYLQPDDQLPDFN